jgi:hypothetical protein
VVGRWGLFEVVQLSYLFAFCDDVELFVVEFLVDEVEALLVLEYFVTLALEELDVDVFLYFPAPF